MADTTGAPHELVTPVLATPPRTELSLVAAALPPPDGDPPRAGLAGAKWRPENVGGGGVKDPCSVSAMVPGANLAPQTGDPLYIWEAEKCTTAQDVNVVEAQARAQRLLEATTSKRLARELWRGDVAVASGWSNMFLTRDFASTPAGAPVVGRVATGSSVAPIPALAALEEAIGEKGSGAPGMIHCSRRTASIWGANQLIFREGGYLVTRLGTRVIADAGYDGSAPGIAGDPTKLDATGITNWAYATGPVTVRLSEIEVTGAQRPNDPAPHANTPDGETVSRDAGTYGPNDRIVIASRYALATFDPAILVGVKIDHSSTAAFSATLP